MGKDPPDFAEFIVQQMLKAGPGRQRYKPPSRGGKFSGYVPKDAPPVDQWRVQRWLPQEREIQEQLARRYKDSSWNRPGIGSCWHCGGEFYNLYCSARYCSYRCKNDAQIARKRERRIAAREPRPCNSCGETFIPRRKDALYCSNACRQRAYRGRNVTDTGLSRRRDKPKAVTLEQGSVTNVGLSMRLHKPNAVTRNNKATVTERPQRVGVLE